MKFAIPFALLTGLFLLATSAIAQYRTVNDIRLLPQLQAEYALHGDDYLLVSLRNSINPTSDDDGLERLGVLLGYEKFWNAQWSGGATLGVDAYSVYRNGSDVSRVYADLTPELFVRHWNTFGGFNFRQRLGVTYEVLGTPGSESRAQTSLRLDLDRLVPVGEQIVLRPRLAYQATAYLRFQRDEATQLKERFIDFGYARAEVGIRLSNRFDFTPWFGYQTTYIFALARLDNDGNIIRAAGASNLITPVLGLDARFTLFRGGSMFERRQLPTQH
ncbi:hypothetical protein F1C16_14290 [Hymenobacter sp. NBH84]|uniref:hypothetical protein n=1 Tax=Hymenobacter sp. NBH84 TaxID=2596915 RepID=UPI0016242E23|nr:hypothetical protein [Hymenobacter sp. NBH84]QNE40651.1 hypothetical protein F1C16_14290 [Hymenobacter sp. NBH84]